VGTIDTLLQEIARLESERPGSEQRRKELSEQIRQKIELLRQEIIDGGSTQNRFLDAVIVNHFSLNPVIVDHLGAIDQEVAAHRGELIMIIEPRMESPSSKKAPPDRPDDIRATKNITFGRLNGTSLVIKSQPIDAQLQEHRSVGFPTSGYIVNPRVNPIQTVVAENFFPKSSLALTHLQPARPYNEDSWSLGTGGIIASLPSSSAGTGGKMLDLYIGDDAVEKQIIAMDIKTPLYLWWIRLALGQTPPLTPDVEAALAKLHEEYLKRVSQYLIDLNNRRREKNIDDLEKLILDTLKTMQRLKIDPTLEIWEQISKCRLP